MFAANQQSMPQYSIKDIEALTGIKSHTLRIWEQRYSILEPSRTSTNIRTYSEEDLRTILNVNVLYRFGYKISKIASWSDDQRREIVLKTSEQMVSTDLQLQGLVTAMMNLDEESLENILDNSFKEIGVEGTTEKLIFPFLKHIGYLWQVGTVDPAFEHFVSQIIRKKLMMACSSVTKLSEQANPKKFLLFLPAGEPHEIGLLLASYIIKDAGHKVLYLGADLPHQDLIRVVEKFQPHYIFCSATSGTLESNPQDIADFLGIEFEDCQVLLTGHSFISSQISLQKNSCLIHDIGDLRALTNA